MFSTENFGSFANSRLSLSENASASFVHAQTENPNKTAAITEVTTTDFFFIFMTS